MFPSKQYPFPRTQYLFQNTQYLFPSTQYLFQNMQCIFPSMQYLFPSMQYLFQNTLYLFPSTQSMLSKHGPLKRKKKLPSVPGGSQVANLNVKLKSYLVVVLVNSAWSCVSWRLDCVTERQGKKELHDLGLKIQKKTYDIDRKRIDD